MILEAEPITAAAFAPFGDVVAAGAGGRDANQGTALRADFAARLESTRPHAKPNLARFSASAQPLPCALRVIERHPCSSQLFTPLVCSRYVVVVAPTADNGEPRWDGLRAFLVGAGQAINYHVGTWHHPIVAVDDDATFLMLSWEDGTAGDCEERPLPQPFTVTLHDLR